jgi:diguanylate cyclase (GGDEF)-like protein/PAS domain S-box-containing protein
VKKSIERTDRSAGARFLHDSGVESVIVTDDEGNITICSPAAASLFGYDALALVGRKIGAIVEDRGRAATVPPAAGFTGVGLRKNGDAFGLDAAVVEINSSGSPTYVWSVRDQASTSIRKDRFDALWRLSIRSDLDSRAQMTAVMDEGRRTLVLDFAALGHVEDAFFILDAALPEDPDKEPGTRVQLRATFSGVVVAAKSTVQLRGESNGRGASIGTTFTSDGKEYVLTFGANAPRVGDFSVDDVLYVELLAACVARLATQGERAVVLTKIAFEDDLTGLPNRAFCIARLKERFAASAHRTDRFGLFLAGLDGLKSVNDLGRSVGDAVLVEAASRLREAAPGADLIARLDGDQFCVIATGATSADSERQAKAIADALARPFEVEGHQIAITACVGVALFPGDADDCETFEANAREALVRAKQSGPGTICFFSAEISANLEARRFLHEALRGALDRKEFVLQYQPLADLSTGSIIGAEGLIRWNHPKRGLVMPNDFIAAAEESGLMIPIGAWVMREACRQCRIWEDEGLDLRVTLNVSAKHFQSPLFVRQMAAAIAQAGVSAAKVGIEITEAVAMQHPGTVQIVLGELRKLGVRIALDDFGTGYSSLAYLKSLPVDIIKIDRSFVGGIPTDNDDASIVRAIIAFALCTGREVHAEGVESLEQARWLQAEGCDSAQGYLFGKAITASSFAGFVKTYNAERTKP